MAETMIERVAKALALKADDNFDTSRQFWSEYARVAIGAMREPEMAMVAAFWRQKNCGTQEIGHTGDARSDYDAWRAAIDAALSEGGE